MVLNTSLFIAPLVVGGIAGLTLSSAAFQLPRGFADFYEKYNKELKVAEKNAAVNVSMGEDIKADMKNDSKEYFLNHITRFGMCRLHLLEISSIVLFLLTEFLIMLLFFYTIIRPNPDDLLTLDQSIFLIGGYILLFLSITLITLTVLVGLIDSVRVNRYIEARITDILSLNQKLIEQGGNP
jgi:hypothetical protein